MQNRKSLIIKSSSVLLAFALAIAAVGAEAKSISSDDESVSAVIPSPNQEFGDTSSGYESDDIVRRLPQQQVAPLDEQQQETEAASNEAAVPIYVSPFVRSERQAPIGAQFDQQESSLAPLNYAAHPSASIATPATQIKDLKTSASYGHHHGHHGGHHGYDHSGWLDMGAWTGGKGSFGWYADYPVGKHGHGYGRK